MTKRKHRLLDLNQSNLWYEGYEQLAEQLNLFLLYSTKTQIEDESAHVFYVQLYLKLIYNNFGGND